MSLRYYLEQLGEQSERTYIQAAGNAKKYYMPNPAAGYSFVDGGTAASPRPGQFYVFHINGEYVLRGYSQDGKWEEKGKITPGQEFAIPGTQYKYTLNVDAPKPKPADTGAPAGAAPAGANKTEVGD